MKLPFMLVALGGVLGWFGFAPYNAWYLGLIVFPLVLKILGQTQGKKAFAQGWLFGFGYFLFGLYWIAHALTVDLAQFWWAVPFALAGLPMFLALFSGVAVWQAQKYAASPWRQALAFTFFWCGVEWLRGHILTGLPWLLWGYSLSDVPAVAQLSAFGGIYSLTLWAVLISALVWPVVAAQSHKRERVLAAGVVLVLALGGYGAGAWWLTQDIANPKPVALRLVQPNIPQSMKYDRAQNAESFAKLLQLTKIDGAADVVIWPESAVPYILAEDDAARQAIASALPAQSLLFTGAVRREAAPDGSMRYYNSVEMLSHEGDILTAYDKSHLVPFGEYIPFQKWLPLKTVSGMSGFTEGRQAHTFELLGLVPPFSPLVCYEVIFPHAVADQTNPPHWLVNVTNDAWYGLTHGPLQHFDIARMRAVEEGIPLVRVANNGITGVTDSHGRVQAMLPLGVSGTLDTTVQTGRIETLYSKVGDTLFMGLLVALYGILRLRRTLS